MGCVQGRAVHGLVFALFVEGWGGEEKQEGRRRAERRDAGRMEGKVRRGVGRGGACLCWDGSPQGCLHWGTPTLVPSLTITSAPWMVEPPHAGLKGNLQVDLL